MHCLWFGLMRHGRWFCRRSWCSKFQLFDLMHPDMSFWTVRRRSQQRRRAESTQKSCLKLFSFFNLLHFIGDELTNRIERSSKGVQAIHFVYRDDDVERLGMHDFDTRE